MKLFDLVRGRDKNWLKEPDDTLPDVKTCVYATCYNESAILPFFLEYYLSFCDEVVIYDNSSTDNSVAIVNSYPNTRIVRYNTGGIRDDILLIMKNNMWKEARPRYDFVIVVDTDEFVYSPDMKKLLRYCKKHGKTVLSPKGYNMIGEKFPEKGRPITEQIKTGVAEWHYNKKAVFDPNSIREMNYTVGAHKAVPRGRVRYFSPPDLKLLHYRYIGRDYYLSKIKNARQSDVNRKNNWGAYLDYPEQHHIDLFNGILKKAEKVI